jgi:hypothetical protein
MNLIAGARMIRGRVGYRDPDFTSAPGRTDADTLVPACWLRKQAHYAGQGWDAIVGTIRVADWSGY